MSSNIIGPLPKYSLALSEKLGKSSGNLDVIKAHKDSVAPSHKMEKSREGFYDK